MKSKYSQYNSNAIFNGAPKNENNVQATVKKIISKNLMGNFTKNFIWSFVVIPQSQPPHPSTARLNPVYLHMCLFPHGSLHFSQNSLPHLQTM